MNNISARLPLVLLPLLVALGCAKHASAPAASGGAAEPPTVLLVTIDTLRADRVGCYGRPDAGTPALDGLAAQGVRCAAAQTTAPLTVPAHASLLSGRTLPAHALFSNSGFVLAPTVPVVAERFRAAGYATGAFVSSAIVARRFGFGRGFDTYDDVIPMRRGQALHYQERPGGVTARAALDWLGAQAGRPVFAWVHFFEPHRPYSPPPELASRYPGDPYQGEVAAADAALASLLDGLRGLGRSGRLLVVVAGDHGESLGEHGELTHGMYLYNATMAVPLVLSGPGWGVRPGVLEAPVSLADVAPTLVALAGLPALDGADGKSLAGALQGRETLPPDRAVFAESHVPSIEFGWSGLRAVVRGGSKLIEAPRRELYDLKGDPAERHDVAAARAADANALAGTLGDLVRRAASAAPAVSAHATSSQDLETLRGLGYVASGAPATRGPLVDPRRVDPKDRADFLRRFDEGVRLVQRGDAAEGCRMLEELRRVEPKNHAVLFELGQGLLQARRLDEAYAVYKAMTEAHPDSSVAWLRLGQLLDFRKDVAGAEAAYRRAAQTDPSAVDARKALASLLAENGRVANAIEELEAAAAIDPSDPTIARDLQAMKARR